jgi:ATP-dependent DNA ligase
VIGGYVPGGNGFGAWIVGYYGGKDLCFVAKVRNRFMPEPRRQVFKQMKPRVTPKCPFVNFTGNEKSPMGAGLTAGKMRECIWLNPELVAQFEFLEWTSADHLRHAKFVGMRDDQKARDVRKES